MSDASKAAVGETQPPGPRLGSVFETCIAAVGTVALECAVLKLFHDGRIPTVTAAAVHLAVLAALGKWIYRLQRAERDLRLPMLLATTTGLLGPIGAAGTLMTLGLYVLYAGSSTPFKEWYEALFPEEESKFSVYLAEQIASGQGEAAVRTGVASFLDVLSFGTPQQKQAVITLIADHFQPSFAPALRRALNDPSNAVRVQAAAAIAAIENNFLARSLELSAAAQERPGDPAALKALARHYDDYAYTGILDGRREQDSREKALEVYRQYLKLQPSDLEARCSMGRILFRMEKFSEAAAWLEESLREGISSPQLLLWYMECLFRLGRFEELRQLARSHAVDLEESGELPLEAVEAVALWAGKTVDASVVAAEGRA